jgi:hypothetical protein
MEIAMAVLKFIGGAIPLIQELLKAFMWFHSLAILYKYYHTNDLYIKNELIYRSFAWVRSL